MMLQLIYLFDIFPTLKQGLQSVKRTHCRSPETYMYSTESLLAHAAGPLVQQTNERDDRP